MCLHIVCVHVPAFFIGTHTNSPQLYASRGRNEKKYREFVMLFEKPNSPQLYTSRGRNEKKYREFVMLLEQLHCKGLTAPV